MKLAKGIMQLLLSVLLATSSFYSVAAYASADTGNPQLESVSLGQFDSGDDGWEAMMDAYQNGFQRDSVNFETKASNRAAQIPGDFSGGYKNGTISRGLPGVDFHKVSFKVKTEDVDHVLTRLIDGTGQTFQQTIAIVPDGQWHTVTIDELTAGDHWGGDGTWHATAWAFQIMTDEDHIVKNPNDHQVEVLVDDVQLYVAEQSGDKAIPIGQFDTGNDGWNATRVSYQNGYQEDPFDMQTVDASEGNYAAKIPGDFSGIYKNGLITRGMPGLDFRKISFKVKTADVDRLVIRLIDGTGQTFQQLVTVEPDNQWHTVMIDDPGAGDYWGGANDGVWHPTAWAFQIMTDRDYIVKNPNDNHVEVLIDDVQQYVEKQAEVTLDHLIDDFEQDSDWYYGYGDTEGVVGSYERTDEDAFEGGYSGKLSANYSIGNQYVTMYKQILDGVDIEKLAFRIKTSDYKSVKVRVVDETGQIFQQAFSFLPTGNWQQIVVNQMSSDGYWHGAADGVWHGPIKGFYILLGRDDLIDYNAGTGEALIDEVTASYKQEDFQIIQSELGNVFIDNEPVKFGIKIPGDQFDWQVTDYWGNIVVNSSASVTDGLAELEIQNLDKGYYMLDVTAFAAGAKLGKKSTSFAILGETIDLHEVDESPFSITTHFAQDWSPSMIPLIQKAGIKNIRDEIYWSDVEQVKGEYRFRYKHETYMNKLKELGIDPLIVLSFNNPYYDGGVSPYTDEGREAFANYGVAVLDHYEDQIKRVEVYNEFNIAFSSGPGAQKTDYYYKLLKETYNKIKAYNETNNKDVMVIGPVTSQIPWEWLEELFAISDEDGKALDYMDAVSVHPYRYPSSPEGMDSEMVRVQQLIKAYNDGNPKPIYITEWGWPTYDSLTKTSEAMQAAYLVRSSVQLLSEGVEFLGWYDFKNDGIDSREVEDNFGIIRHETDPLGKYAPKPAYVSFSAMTRALTGADFVSKEEIGEDIYSYLFERGSEQIRVMWSPSEKRVTMDADAAMLITNVVGHETTLTPYNGQVSVDLTEYPIFVRGDVEDIQAGGRYSIEAADESLVGDDIALKLVVDNTSSAQALTAKFVIRGESYEVSAPIGERVERSVSISGYMTPGQTITLSGEVYVADQRVAAVSTNVHIIDPLDIRVVHAISEEQDVIRLEISNHSDKDYLLESVDWSINGGNETIEVDDNIGANATTVYDIELPSLVPGTYLYGLDLHIANYPLWSQSGKLIQVDHDLLTPVSKKTISINSNQYAQEAPPTVNLEHDGSFSHLADHTGVNDLSGDIWLNWDEDYVYLSAVITDDIHHQSAIDREIWQGDSIQFGVSSGAPGEILNSYEYGIALTSHLGPQLYRWAGMNGAPVKLIDNRELTIVRDDVSHTTQYKLALPWSELSPVKASDELFSFSILVNENDGAGRRGWAEWGAGIGASKETKLYQAMKFVVPDPTEQPVTAAAISGVTAPVRDGTPVATLADTAEYTATIDWSPADATFAASTVYTATITLTPKAGYTLTGVAANFFTVAGATTTSNVADSGVVTAVFPATAAAPEENGGTTSPPDDRVTATPEAPSKDGKAKSEGEGQPDGAVSFTDVAGHWAAAQIGEAVKKGIINGYKDGTFRPDGIVTRAEFAAMMGRGLQLPAGGDVMRFADAAQIPAWAQDGIAKAVNAGIIKGYSDQTFAPNRQISRAEMAVMIARAAQLDSEVAEPTFSDHAAIAPWARGSIAAVADAGLMSGKGGNRFAPNDQTTRAEAVAVILRLLEYKK